MTSKISPQLFIACFFFLALLIKLGYSTCLTDVGTEGVASPAFMNLLASTSTKSTNPIRHESGATENIFTGS